MNFSRAHFVRYLALLILSACALLPQSALTAQGDGKSALSFLTGGNTDDNNAFLPPDEAFKLNLVATSNNVIEAQFTITPEHYLYRDRIQFAMTPNDASTATLANVVLPAGDLKNDPNFGEQMVFHHSFAGQLILANVNSDSVNITATYQGCSEKGLCYAPIKKILNVNLQTLAPSTAHLNQNNPNATNLNVSATSDDDRSASLLKTGNIWLVVAGFFAAGLLLSLTPCVLPMIPILSSIIVGSRKSASKRYTFGLSVAYVFGMAFSYTLAGVAAGLSGNLLSQSLQNAWVLGASSSVFVLLALSMFGFYELKLPQRFEDKIVNTSNHFKGGQFVGVFVMGALSALIVSPCVAAPLAGALIYISQTQNVLLGGIALFCLALGMGVPLLLIGASAGQLLPKAGDWMNGVRHFFGVVMLGMAIWLITPVIPLSISFVLWAALLIVTAVYLNALDPLPTPLTARHHRFARFWKGIGVALLIVGIALMIGSVSGAKSLLRPLSGITTAANSAQNATHLDFTRVTSLSALNAHIANANGKPVMLDFYADWCVACKELEAYTFSNNKVQTKLKDTLLLQVDVTKNSLDDQALLKRFALFGPPGIVFFDKQGQEINAIKTIGFQNVNAFLETLSRRDSLL